MSKNQSSDSASVNIITKDTIIKGELQCDGDIRIEGKLEGSLISKGKLVVGVQGKIEGTIISVDADISGVIEAEVRIKELLQLRGTAQLVGNLHVGKLSVEPGAKLSGNCVMNIDTQPLDQEKKKIST